ncbi:MAG TPA: hypothetical protein EYN58_02835 [Candidatus Poseidoniales archaeon]|nr:hypothetical protein [Candidatus Poseidoniales archaeon]
MNMFELRSKECIAAMRDTLRYLDEKREQLRKSSSNARRIIVDQIVQTKESILRINSEFQILLDEMMQPSSPLTS